MVTATKRPEYSDTLWNLLGQGIIFGKLEAPFNKTEVVQLVFSSLNPVRPKALEGSGSPLVNFSSTFSRNLSPLQSINMAWQAVQAHIWMYQMESYLGKENIRHSFVALIWIPGHGGRDRIRKKGLQEIKVSDVSTSLVLSLDLCTIHTDSESHSLETSTALPTYR